MSIIRTVLRTVLSKNAKSLGIPRLLKKLSTLPPNILDSGLPDVPISELSVPEFVFEKCAKYEHLTAIVSTTIINKLSGERT